MSTTHLIYTPKILTTAEILYHLPDYPELLQTFLWQNMDTAPQFPVLYKFLTYWSQNLDGKLHSVRVATQDTGWAREYTFAATEITYH